MDSKSSFILTFLLPVAIALIMFGLGLGLTREDFLRLFKFPKVTLIGLAAKILVMPVTAFGLSRLFGLSPEFSVGLVLVAAGPCSVMANVFTKMAKGNVALGLTFTAVDNFVGAVTLPLYAGLAIYLFMDGEAQRGFLFADSVKIFLLMFIPVSLGMAMRKKYPRAVPRLETFLRNFSVVFLIFLFCSFLAVERERIFSNFAQLAGATLLLTVFGLFYGYFGGKLLRFTKQDSMAIAFALPIQGTTVIGTVAISVLNNINFGIPAAIYTIFMYLAGFSGVWVFKRLK